MIFYIIVAVLSYLLYKFFLSSNKGVIDLPGPKPWPIVGNILQIDGVKPHLTLDKWHREHGKVFKYKQLGETVVVMGDAEAMHEALVQKGFDFAGRPVQYRMKMWSEFNHEFQDGIVFCPPEPTWKKLKNVVQSNLKQFDSGLMRVQETVEEVSNDLTEQFISYNGEPFEPRPHLMNAVMNNTTIFLLGRKFSLDDELFKQLQSVNAECVEVLNVVGKHALVDVMPWLRFFGYETFNRIEEWVKDTHKLYLQMRKAMVPSSQADRACMVEDLQAHVDEVVGGQLRLEKTTLNLMVAGVATSTSTLDACLNILTHYKDVQNKIQAEIEDVIGERLVKLVDRDQMPYTRATIFEVLRYTSIVPAFPHMTTVDTELQGVKIPANTTVLLNLFSELHDADYWPEPYTFKPERFLDEDGNLVAPDHINRKRLMAFGAGARVCMGQKFALLRLFLLVVHVLQKFDLEQDEPKVSPDPRTYDLNQIFTPAKYQLRAIPRNIAT